MRLNPDCVRDILMLIENTVMPDNSFEYRYCEDLFEPNSLKSSFDELSNYADDEILYHLKQCCLNELFYKYSDDITGKITIVDLTPKAHDFLANIRNNNIWDKAKDISKTIGVKSVLGLTQVAGAIVTELIKKQMGLS